MFLANWLSGVNPKSKRSRQQRTPRRTKPGSRLQLEQLETRLTPALALTAAGQALGLSLTTFASGFASNGTNSSGPIGLAYPTNGSVLVGDVANNLIYVFPTDTDNQAAGSVTTVNPGGQPLGMATVNGKNYLAINSTIVRLNNNGTQDNTFTPIAVSAALGVGGDPVNGHLFVSSGPNLVDVDPVARTVTQVAAVGGPDGVTVSPDGKTVYVANTGIGHLQGYDTTTHALVFDSGAIGGGIDGSAIGSGPLAGNAFVNTNSGTVIEVNLATMAQTVIATGGSRGDFASDDPHNGSFLLTQSDTVVRLSATNSPAPTITSFSPGTLPESAGPLTLTVNGTHFFPDAIVQFNGTDLATTFVSANQLTAVVPAASLAEEGSASVVVFNPGFGGGPSPATPFTITDPAVQVVNPAQLQAVATVYGTGLDTNGALLAGGANDPHWSYTLSDVSDPPAVVVTSPAGNGWAGNTATSQWVSTNAAGSPPVGPTITFETTFDLTGYAYSTAKITGQFMVDDPGVTVLLNGVNTGITGGTYNGFTAFTISSGFLPGVNTLDFVTSDSIGGPGGLQVQMSATTDTFSSTGNAITAVEGTDTGTVTLATFVDPGGLEALTNYSATVSWGDGSPADSATPTIVDNGDGTYSVQAHHKYVEESGANPYAVTVTIHHESAPDAIANATATVSDPSPVVQGGKTFTPVEGQSTGLITVATFTDPGGLEPIDEYSASVDWGDGSGPDSTTPVIVNNHNGTYSVKASHTYAEESDPGTPYQISVSVFHGTSPSGTDLVVNGGFEQPVGFGQYASIPGWTLTPGTGGGTIELDGSNIGTAFEGNQFDELNAFGPGTISQTVPTEAGHTYVLSFAFSARPGTNSAENNVRVSFDGNVVTTVTADGTGLGNTQWKVYTFTVTASGTSTVLQFASLTDPDDAGASAGGLIDAVRLVAGVTDTATVSDPSVVATGGFAITAVEGQPTGLVTLATFTDPGGLEGTGHYSATVNWGDQVLGTTEGSPVIVDNGNGTYSVQANYTYDEESGAETPNSTPYQITVTIFHENSTPTVVHDTATVSDPAVIATGSGALTAVEGTDTGAVTLATFTDPAGLETIGDYSATVNWGDGSPADATTTTIVDNDNGTFSVKAHHKYQEESNPEEAGTNPYSVTITIHHESAPDAVAHATFTVSDPAVVPTAVNVTGVEGKDTGMVTLATFTDPGGLDALADYRAAVNWGDGTPVDNITPTIIDNHNGTYGVAAHHLYKDESPTGSSEGPTGYTVTVTVFHNNAPTAAVTGSAVVSDPALLNVAGGLTFNAVEGADTALEQLATFTDPGGPGDADYTATINWGDGTAVGTATVANNRIVDLGPVAGGESFAVVGHHTYLTSGTLPITVTVRHESQTATVVMSTAVISPDVVIVDTTGGKNLTVYRTLNGPIGNITYVLGNNAPVSLTAVRSFTYNGQAGGDSMTVNYGNGAPLLPVGIAFNGLQSPDVLTIVAAGQALRTAPTRVSAGPVLPQAVSYTGAQTVLLNDAVAVNAIAGPDTKDRATAFVGLTAQERFVQAVYLAELGRVGSVAELDLWGTLFAGQTQDQGQAAIANGIARGAEARNHLVASWYQAFLGRLAQNGEEQQWANLMLQGQTEEQVLSQILGDGEFYARAQTLSAFGTADERYAKALYRLLLDREGAPAEIANTVAAMGQSGRRIVALAFLQAQEFRACQFEGYYNALLHRPDGGGLNAYVFSNLDSTTARVSFEAGSEFFTNG